MIPEYEEREAARFGNYRWMDWLALPLEERVAGVAHYRTNRLVQMHESEVTNEHIERESERARSQSRGRQRLAGDRFLGGRPRGR